MYLIMRAIIPVAGNGSRLRPITEYKNKIFIEVAGRPVIDHIIRKLLNDGLDELVLIVGYQKETVIDWMKANYSDTFSLQFVEQEKPLGLGHAIYCAKEFLDGEVLLTLGDEIFSRDYSAMLKIPRTDDNIDASVGTMFVTTPSHYGMVKIDEENRVEYMIEKPQDFDGTLALAGAYYFRDSEKLRSSLEVLINQENRGKEYQLTDALQMMVEDGAHFTTFEVGLGYDCGRLESIVTSNRLLLEHNHYVDELAVVVNSKIIAPCYIGSNARISDSTVGPFVSVGSDARVTGSSINDAIVESRAIIDSSTIDNCIVSEHTILKR